MSIRRITTIITTALSFVLLAFVIVACDTNQGMMHGSNNMSTGIMAGWNWIQIIVSLVVGFVLCYLFNSIVSKKRQ